MISIIAILLFILVVWILKIIEQREKIKFYQADMLLVLALFITMIVVGIVDMLHTRTIKRVMRT